MLKKEDLAAKTELSTNYIGMIERGEKIPALDSFIKICNALEVSADKILIDVLVAGYKTKESLLSEKLENLTPDNRERIYDVIDTLIKHAK